ncbi:unnamed protein product [Adineta ricciae]|uniref:Homeobox protein cut-like n=1 Tax=Adineta ricciae TaxID=249248 RepID=A0A813NBC7_ADIRI|nr:unnamed protein product [Adineta ricciae]
MFLDHDSDVTTTEIDGRADESDQSRRKLVKLSRDLKKNTNEIEIDNLTEPPNHITEESLLEIYQHFSEFPDPVQAHQYAQTLQKSLEKVSDLALPTSLDQLADAKISGLSIKQLRDKIKDLEEKTSNHIRSDEDHQRIFADKNHQLTRRLKYAQMEIHQSALDHRHQDMLENTTNTCSSDLDILNQDLQQTHERTSNAERLVDKLCDELEQTHSTNTNSDELISQEETERKLREKLELELVSKEHQIATLVVETQKLQSTLIKLKETSVIQISDLENVVSGKEKLIAQLESKLQSQADYEEIKQELTILKSAEPSTSTRPNVDQMETLPKKALEILLLDKNRSLQAEPVAMKAPQIDSENETNQQQAQHSCLQCTSSCLHRATMPFIAASSLLSSSTSSSSNSSSSPSSPSQIYLKPHLQPTTTTTLCNGSDDMTRSFNDSTTKFLPPVPNSLSIITAKDNIQLCNSTNSKYPSMASSCSTMVTPTASLLSAVTTTTSLTPSNLFPGQQLSSVQCTKLHCPPTSSWSPPLSTSSGISSIATTSTDNRTVLKPPKPSSPKPSAGSTIPTNTTTVTSANTNSHASNLLEPLDTSYVANVVRKLLAQHNIGQRIFARYILSLSQGTVSELLSKPKCWSKLTEKGKESYRKMWCWANSEESILTLKSISPRKGMNNRSKDNPYPAVSTKHTDPATQKKIEQILADAQKQQMAAAVVAAANMESKTLLSPCSSLPNDPSNSIESKTPSSSGASSIANSPLNEPTASEQQSFLLPIPPPSSLATSSSTSTTPPTSLSMLSAFVPSLLMRTANGLKNDSSTLPTAGNLIDCSMSSPFSLLCHQPDNYRNWLMLQEIVRNNDLLKQFQPAFPVPIENDAGSDQGNDDDDDDDDGDDENEENEHDDELDDDNPTSSDETPLDLSMKCDSNHHETEPVSMRLSNNKQQPSSSSTKHVKTALAPLREQDTSKYRYVNTAELVQTVKDILSRYSISQRHFGEKILGLSQGSVSDILARPKQWELLTQKGREPFLRMRIFLDDPNAIKQLVQTVSTTPTTNTNSILLPTFCPPLPPSLATSSSGLPTSSLLSNATLNGFHSNNLLTRDNSTDSQSNNDSLYIATNESTLLVPTSTTSTPLPSNGISNNSNKSKSRSKSAKPNNDKPASNQSRQSSANPLMAPYELPKIVLPSSIDTEQLSSQVRELLFAYSIGQRVFGEAVLNLSQGTVSEILSKPRPWHSLSVKGREPYIRMYTWYNDTGNVQKLLAWKRERDALRRCRPPAPPKVTSQTDNGDSESGNNNPSSPANRPKRRYLFTDEQRRVLKQTFENEPYPSQATLEQLVTDLSLPMNKIANWFHNSRMRAKTNIRPSSSPTSKYSTSSLLNDDLLPAQSDDDEDDIDDNNNNNNNNPNDDDDDDDEDDYPIIPTIVPLTSSWLNGTNDSNSSSSPLGLSATSTNTVSLIDNQKTPPPVSSSTNSSSSKKRKSVPQKIVTNNNNHLNKKFQPNSTRLDIDSNDEANPTTNESTTFVDILT